MCGDWGIPQRCLGTSGNIPLRGGGSTPITSILIKAVLDPRSINPQHTSTFELLLLIFRKSMEARRISKSFILEDVLQIENRLSKGERVTDL